MEIIDNELVTCIYDDEGPDIEQKIIEAFIKYIRIKFQNIKS